MKRAGAAALAPLVAFLLVPGDAAARPNFDGLGDILLLVFGALVLWDYSIVVALGFALLPKARRTRSAFWAAFVAALMCSLAGPIVVSSLALAPWAVLGVMVIAPAFVATAVFWRYRGSPPLAAPQ
jgi:hypothetical protein